MYDKYVLGSDLSFTFAGLHSYEEGPDGKTRFLEDLLWMGQNSLHLQ